MKLVKVNELPKRKRYTKLQAYWEEFMKMNTKIVKVDLNGHKYSNANVAYSTFYKSIKRFGYPIDVKRIGGDIYLIRRDV